MTPSRQRIHANNGELTVTNLSGTAEVLALGEYAAVRDALALLREVVPSPLQAHRT